MGIIINGQNDTIGPVDNSMSLLGTVSIGGTMTIEDFTNIDSVGLITARNGLQVTGGNVAIGHNNPLNTLHVKGPTGGVSARFTDAVNATVLVSHPSSGKSKIADAGGNYGFEFDTASVNILSGGSERLRITSTGHIGIGENNPSTVLHVAGSLTLENSSGTGNSWTYYKNADRTWLVGVRGSSNDALSFYDLTADVERFRISSTGHLLQGTTTEGAPGADNLTLASSGTAGMTIRSGTSGNGNIYFSDSTSGAAEYDGFIQYQQSNQAFRFATAGTERLRIASDGKIHVGGNGTGTDQLNIIAAGSGINIARVNSGNASVNEWLGALGFKGYATGNSSSGADARIHANAAFNHSATSAPANLIFSTKGTTEGPGSSPVERMRITYDGKVGIGEDSPDRLLHIKGASSTAYSGGSDTADYNFLKIENTTNDRSAGIFFQIGGNGEAAITATEVSDGNTVIAFQNRGGGVRSEKLRIDSSGRLLVGTTSADSNTRLHVSAAENTSDPMATDASIVIANTQNAGNNEAAALKFNVGNTNTASISAHYDSFNAGVNSSLRFYTQYQSGFNSPAERMRITSEGYVTKSNHPCFDAVRNSGNMSGPTYINYNTVKANNGGHYNSSNGRFTAPVAGYYFFSWTSIKNNTNTVTRLYIHKNGNAAYGNRHLRLDAGQDYGDNGTMTAVIQLAKNDYVQIYLGAGQIYGVTEEYCIFNGYLLG